MTVPLHSHMRPNIRRARRRDGLFIVAALVCLIVVTSIVGSMLKCALAMRRELLAERDCRQAELLLLAGVGRATARLATVPDFPGDTWEVSSEAIVGRGPGRVTTKVTRTATSGAWDVHIVADYPLNRDVHVRRSRTFHIPSSETQRQE